LANIHHAEINRQNHGAPSRQLATGLIGLSTDSPAPLVSRLRVHWTPAKVITRGVDNSDAESVTLFQTDRRKNATDGTSFETF